MLQSNCASCCASARTAAGAAAAAETCLSVSLSVCVSVSVSVCVCVSVFVLGICPGAAVSADLTLRGEPADLSAPLFPFVCSASLSVSVRLSLSVSVCLSLSVFVPAPVPALAHADPAVSTVTFPAPPAAARGAACFRRVAATRGLPAPLRPPVPLPGELPAWKLNSARGDAAPIPCSAQGLFRCE